MQPVELQLAQTFADGAFVHRDGEAPGHPLRRSAQRQRTTYCGPWGLGQPEPTDAVLASRRRSAWVRARG